MASETTFTWDANKSAACQAERGFDFVYAARIFLGPTREETDERKDYPETRMRVYGRINGKPYRIVYTQTDETTKHIISAHRIREKEIRKWL